jgi:hypothetical protein
MRFVFATDFHVADQLGAYRQNCLADILAKVQFVVDTAAAHNADVIVVGGDWFNSPKLGYSTQWALLEILDQFPQWVGVLGQHDIHGHALETARHSPAGALLRAPNVEILSRSVVQIKGVRILGFSYVDDIVQEAQSFDEGDDRSHDIGLVIYHALIVPQNPGQFMVDPAGLPCFGPLAACGDYHAGFPVTGVRGTMYANPGALTRTTPSDGDREPALLLGRIDDEVARFTDRIPVPHRPASEVFDIEHWLHDLAHKESLAARTSLFAEAVKTLGVASTTVMDEIIEVLGKDTPRSVVNRALNYLRQAEAPDV